MPGRAFDVHSSDPPTPETQRLLAALASYVPPLILEELAREGLRPAEPREAAFSGVVMVTDIAGFTRLTERMDQAGPLGVEELSRLLNAYFSDLIETVHDHGGRVMKFAGDALMAVWPAEEMPLSETAHRAAQCAALVQEKLGRYPVIEDVTLSMRASLGAGQVRHMILGGVRERWVSRLGGPAMEGARRAISAARPGEVLLTRETAEAIGDQAVCRPSDRALAGLHELGKVRELAPRAAPATQVPHYAGRMLFSHAQESVRDRIVAGHDDWLAEFRRISVLFINVPDVDDAHGDRLDRAHTVTVLIQTILERYEASVDNLGDDHAGLVMVAALGLPAGAHEDDASRAARIALGVRRELRDAGFQCAIGITTGRLFCGAIGSARRRSYSMVGDAMNRAARLMSIAEGDIYCDEQTHQAAERHLHFEFLRSVELKGKSKPVAIYRPLHERVQAAPKTRAMIGRQAERGLLQHHLETLRSSAQGGVIFLEAEAGMGKSTLLEDVRTSAHALGLRVVTGTAEAIERASSYHAWRRVFSDLLEFPLDASVSERADLLLDRFAGDQRTQLLAPLLNPVLGLHLPENTITALMDAPSRSEAVLNLLVGFLRTAAARQPLVVLLEDCHWLDSASWALTAELHRQISGLLFVLSARPLPVGGSEPWLPLRRHALAEIHLGPLPPEEILELVCRRLGIKKLPDTVAAFILEKAGGHPFFSEELGCALHDSGHLVIRHTEAWLAESAGDLKSLDFPTTVQGVVRERIDRLSPRERLVIKVASIAGQSFSLRLLRAIYPVEADAEFVPACLDRLVELDLAVPAEGEGELAFHFKHAIVQEVAYHQLVFGQRKQLHRRLAEHLELADGENFPVLAHHWTRAEAPEKAMSYLGRAGDQALQRFSNREAVSFLQQALHFARRQDLPAEEWHLTGRWNRQLGHAHFHLGHMDESRRCLSEATRLLGFPVPSGRRLKMLSLPRALTRQIFNRLRRKDPSLRPAHANPQLTESIAAFSLLGQIAFFTNDLTASTYACIQGLNLAERLGASSELAEAMASMAVVAAALPAESLGELYVDLTQRALSRIDQPVTRAYVEELLAIFSSGLGHWEKVDFFLQHARETFQLFGNSRRVEECLLNSLYADLHRGRLQSARETLTQLNRSAQRREDPQTLGWARLFESQLLLVLEGPAASLRCLEKEQLFRSDALTLTGYYAAASLARFRLEDWDGARQTAEIALERIAEVPPLAYTMMLYTSYPAEVFLGLQARAQAVRKPDPALAALVRKSCALLDRFSRSFPLGHPRALLWRGVQCWQAGRLRAAQKAWQASARAAQTLGMPGEARLAEAWLAGPAPEFPLADGGAELMETR